MWGTICVLVEWQQGPDSVLTSDGIEGKEGEREG